MSFPKEFRHLSLSKACLLLLSCAHCNRPVVLEVQVMDDDHKYPRPHWHARIACDCGITVGWWVVSEQLSDNHRYDDYSSISEKRVEELITVWNTRCYQ